MDMKNSYGYGEDFIKEKNTERTVVYITNHEPVNSVFGFSEPPE